MGWPYDSSDCLLLLTEIDLNNTTKPAFSVLVYHCFLEYFLSDYFNIVVEAVNNVFIMALVVCSHGHCTTHSGRQVLF